MTNDVMQIKMVLDPSYDADQNGPIPHMMQIKMVLFAHFWPKFNEAFNSPHEHLDAELLVDVDHIQLSHRPDVRLQIGDAKIGRGDDEAQSIFLLN